MSIDLYFYHSNIQNKIQLIEECSEEFSSVDYSQIKRDSSHPIYYPIIHHLLQIDGCKIALVSKTEKSEPYFLLFVDKKTHNFNSDSIYKKFLSDKSVESTYSILCKKSQQIDPEIDSKFILGSE